MLNIAISPELVLGCPLELPTQISHNSEAEDSEFAMSTPQSSVPDMPSFASKITVVPTDWNPSWNPGRLGRLPEFRSPSDDSEPVVLSITQGSKPEAPSSASKKSHRSPTGNKPENVPGFDPCWPLFRSTTISVIPVMGSWVHNSLPLTPSSALNHNFPDMATRPVMLPGLLAVMPGRISMTIQ